MFSRVVFCLFIFISLNTFSMDSDHKEVIDEILIETIKECLDSLVNGAKKGRIVSFDRSTRNNSRKGHLKQARLKYMEIVMILWAAEQLDIAKEDVSIYIENIENIEIDGLEAKEFLISKIRPQEKEYKSALKKINCVLKYKFEKNKKLFANNIIDDVDDIRKNFLAVWECESSKEKLDKNGFL